MTANQRIVAAHREIEPVLKEWRKKQKRFLSAATVIDTAFYNEEDN